MSESAADDLLRSELEQRVEWSRARGHLYDLAVWQLVCGRAEEGLESLRTAAAPSGAFAVDPRVALLAGETGRAVDTAAQALRAPRAEYVPGYREYISAVHALIAGDDGTAHASLEALREYERAAKSRPRNVPAGASELLAGLVAPASEAVERGLDALLAWHLRRARARGEIYNSARAVVSLDATVAMLLAHRTGLAPAVADRYRAAAVPVLVVHVSEWGGEAVPARTTLRLTTDLVAGGWLRLHGVDA